MYIKSYQDHYHNMTETERDRITPEKAYGMGLYEMQSEIKRLEKFISEYNALSKAFSINHRDRTIDIKDWVERFTSILNRHEIEVGRRK